MAKFTKNAIIEAFGKLLETRSIEKITVKDIVEECGVNRKTFYYYFKDIYDLTEYVFRISLEDFAEKSRNEDNIEKLVNEFFEGVYKNRRIVMHVFNTSDRAVFEGYIYRVFNTLLLNAIKEKTAGYNVADEDIELISEMYSTIFIGSLSRWLQSGMKHDVNEKIRRSCALVRGTLELMIKNSMQNDG